MRSIIIFGATSAIAEATARLFAQNGDRICLVARNTEKLTRLENDLTARGAKEIISTSMDMNEVNQHAELIEKVSQQWGKIDIALIAHGTLPDQKACEASVELTLAELNTNAISTVALLTRLANQMESQGSGTLAVISSVAGDRGRQSNYVYGAAKGMVTRFLQGLRNRLAAKGVQVLDIKPGFVDTPMTESFTKGALWAQPEDIANCIVKGIEGKKSTIYTPWFWQWIMLIIKSIPEPIFKRLKL